MMINGKQVCSSSAIYAPTSQVEESNAISHVNGTIWETVKDMTECEKYTDVKKGDTVTLVANFDIEKHPQYEGSTWIGRFHIDG